MLKHTNRLYKEKDLFLLSGLVWGCHCVADSPCPSLWNRSSQLSLQHLCSMPYDSLVKGLSEAIDLVYTADLLSSRDGEVSARLTDRLDYVPLISGSTSNTLFASQCWCVLLYGLFIYDLHPFHTCRHPEWDVDSQLQMWEWGQQLIIRGRPDVKVFQTSLSCRQNIPFSTKEILPSQYIKKWKNRGPSERREFRL